MADDVQPMPVARPAHRQCRRCGDPFTVDVSEQEALHAIAAQAGWPRVHLPSRCRSCRAADRAQATAATPGPDQAAVCVDCGVRFVITTGERAALHARRWQMRRRCEACLSARAAAKAMS